MPNRRAAVLILVMLAALPSSAAAAPADQGASAKAWTAITGALAARGPQGAPVETRPRKFEAFTLDHAALHDRLAGAPLELTRGARSAPAPFSIPAPDGTLQRFEAVESPVMEPGLARKHPSYKSFAAVGIDDPTATARFDINSLGFHASVRSERGAWYVDPYYRGADTVHVAYFARDLGNVHGPLIERQPSGEPDRPTGTTAGEQARAGEIVSQRVYRLALISDPEYATYHGAANVTAAKMTLMNRVNQLYNDDLAIKMVLIGNNDLLNLNTEAAYSGPGGPCTVPCYPTTNASPATDTGESCDGQTIVQNNVVADTVVGPDSYDIGHITLGRSPGGVALLGVVGDPAQKASGCTGLLTPTGDFFAIDYVAHEMGHQFSGNHTFNGNQHNCSGGNRNRSTSVEPGSGSSFQAYAGICRQDNLQPHSDPYFSQRSIEEIQAYVTSNIPGSTNQGDQVIATTNHSPVVTAPMDKTIPLRTPFTLTGSATDADAGQALIHLWEQNDVGTGAGIALTNNAKPNGPLFRVFGTYANVTEPAALMYQSPGENLTTSADFTRTFPDPAQIAAGNTNAASGTCPLVTLAPPSPAPAPAPPPLAIPIVDCYSEFLPTAARELNFRLTSRDRFATGGGVSADDVKITVAGTTPFAVTSQPSASSVGGGSVIPVTWNVAGTNAAPFSTPNVRILYSTDGGLTFPTVLAATTANDGTENVTIPTTVTTLGRIRVEAVDNYFFDVTRGNLTVTTDPATTAVPSVTPTVTPTATTPPSGAATATPTYVVPTPTATTIPNRGFLRPEVSRTAKRLKVKGNRTVKVRVTCLAFNSPSATRCRGTVGLFAKIDGGKQRRIARKAISVPRGKTQTVTLKLSARSFRILNRRGGLRAKVRARTNGGASRKQVTLRP